MSYMSKFFKDFHNDEGGVVAIIVALSLALLLFGVLSLSIDLNRAQTTQTHNHNATDAAALAGAEMWLQSKIKAIGTKPDPLNFKPSLSEMESYVKNILKTNFSQDQSGAKFLDDASFVVKMEQKKNIDGKTAFNVNVEACAQISTPFSSVSKHSQSGDSTKAKTCTASKAGFEIGQLENTEIAFALDFTSSMYWKGRTQSCPINATASSTNPDCPAYNQTKAANLQTAMKYILDTYFTPTNTTAFASIVPYTSYVNVYPYNDNGLVAPESGRIDFAGKTWRGSNYDDPNNAWSRYRPISMQMSKGKDMQSYSANGLYIPFYTYDDAAVGDPEYRTKNYTEILNRVPTIADETKLDDVINSAGAVSVLPFASYASHVRSLATQNPVYDPSKSGATNFSSSDINDHFAKMICYQYTVAGTTDERVDGAMESSQLVRGTAYQNGRYKELHESFPVQPLTNQKEVLQNVTDRFVADTALTNAYSGSEILDLQSNPVDKARILTNFHGTSSIHGLMWAWFTLKNDWAEKWDTLSLHETYVTGGNKSARDGSGGKPKLPSANNYKHIILISDGFDNDGTDESNNGTLYPCDAYTPIASVTDTQYNRLCTAIKTNNTPSDNKDDVVIHTILYDFDGPASGNRFKDCASDGAYYNNVAPADLQKVLDQIFMSILTNQVSVKLLKN